MPRNPNVRATRRWCFTLNNPTAAEELQVQSAHPVTYLIYGREVGDSGTPHLQGYVQFRESRSLNSVRAIIGGRAHLEPARGTGEQNRDYCSKSDPTPFQKGELSTQGERHDLGIVVSDIKSGTPLLDLIESHPDVYMKYHGAIDKIYSAFMPTRDWIMNVTWCYGPTGTGKSHYAATIAGDSVYRKMPGKWWDGYTGQTTVIFDEFRADWFTFYQLLLILDKYPLQIEIKNGTRQFCSRNIIITAPVKWDEMFRGQTQEKLNQLERRITETKYFGTRYATDAMEVELDLDQPEDQFVPFFRPFVRTETAEWPENIEDILID